MKTVVAFILLAIVFSVHSQGGDKVTLNFNFGEIITLTSIVEPSEAPFPPLPRETIPPSDLLVTMEQLRVTTLPKLLSHLNLTAAFKNNSNQFTVFAPTDGAFSGFSMLNDLLQASNFDKLAGIMGYHVVQGKYSSDQLAALPILKTVEGEPISITSNPLGLFINGVSVKQADVAASNGVLHVIRDVLVPPSYRTPNLYEVCAGIGKNFTYLTQFAPNITSLLKSAFVNMTLFCPLDDAFTLLGGDSYITKLQNLPVASLTQILSYYILPQVWDEEQLNAGLVYPNNTKNVTTLSGYPLSVGIRNLVLRVDQVLIRQFDVQAFNGLVQIIDRVLLPPPFKMDVIQEAAALGLTSWLSLVQSNPSLVAKITGTGPFTFFIPNNQALVNFTLAPGLIPTFVLYSVVGGLFDVNSLPKNSTLPTQAGGQLTFTTSTTNNFVNNVTIVSADIPVVNGMIQIVNQVIFPPSSLFASPSP